MMIVQGEAIKYNEIAIVDNLDEAALEAKRRKLLMRRFFLDDNLTPGVCHSFGQSVTEASLDTVLIHSNFRF